MTTSGRLVLYFVLVLIDGGMAIYEWTHVAQDHFGLRYITTLLTGWVIVVFIRLPIRFRDAVGEQ